METKGIFKSDISVIQPQNFTFTNPFDTNPSVTVDGEDIVIKPRAIPTNVIRTLLGSRERFDTIFTGRNPLEYRFNSYFKFEVIKIFEHVLNRKGSKIGIDVAKAKEILAMLNPEIDYNNLPDIDRSHIEDVFDFKILPHQETAIKNYLMFKHILGYRGMLLHGAVGTAKSSTSLFIMEGLHKEIDKVIIICPLNTVNKVWESTLSGIPGTGFKYPQSQISLARTTKYQDEKYIICHYEAIEKLQELLPLIKGNIGIIVDESHNLNDVKSKRTQLLLDTIEKTKTDNVILLSGTPVKSGFRELLLIFKYLDRRFDNRMEKRFIKLYYQTNNFLREVLKERYNGYTTVIKKDVLNLNPVTTVNVRIDLPEEIMSKFYLTNIKEDLKVFIEKRRKELEDQKDYWEAEFYRLLEIARSRNTKLQSTVIYNDYLKKVNTIRSRNIYFDILPLLAEVNKFEKNEILPYLEGEDKKQFREAKTIYKYPMFKIQGEALANIVGKARIECHKVLAEYLDYPSIINSTEKKTIVFSSYIDVCNVVKDRVKFFKYNPITVYGEDSKNLSQSVNKFTNDKNLNPLITTYKSLSTGVPLIAADTIICVDLPFRMYIYEQAIGRAWRLGQDSDVTVYILELNTDIPNINSRNIDIIKFFKEEVEQLTGVPSSIDISNDVNVNIETESLTNDSNVTDTDDEYLYDVINAEADALPKINKTPNRIIAEKYILEYIDKIVSGKKNTILYKELFDSMTNDEFEKFMISLRDGTGNLSIVVPQGDESIKCSVENNYKIAKELNVKFFQKLDVEENDEIPAYKTTNDYMIVKLPIRRAAQLLSKKISLSEHDNKIDPLTGQVISESRSSKFTYPELQVLLGQGFNVSLRELMKVRGGDIGIGNALNKILYDRGNVTQAELEMFSTGVQSTKTLKVYLNGAHIKNTL